MGPDAPHPTEHLPRLDREGAELWGTSPSPTPGLGLRGQCRPPPPFSDLQRWASENTPTGRNFPTHNAHPRPRCQSVDRPSVSAGLRGNAAAVARGGARPLPTLTVAPPPPQPLPRLPRPGPEAALGQARRVRVGARGPEGPPHRTPHPALAHWLAAGRLRWDRRGLRKVSGREEVGLRLEKAAMEEPPLRGEEEGPGEQEQEEDSEEDEDGPEGALGKSPSQLTTEDVYDISYVVGRELMALGSDPRVTQLQFKIVRVLEMLETLVSQGHLTSEELRLERDSLRKEVELLRREAPAAASGEASLGPDKMVVDLTDPNRPRFTLQELRDVLQERNKLKSQLLLVQEELQCYKSGLMTSREGLEGRREKDALVSRAGGASGDKEEKTIMRKLFSFRPGKQP